MKKNIIIALASFAAGALLIDWYNYKTAKDRGYKKYDGVFQTK